MFLPNVPFKNNQYVFGLGRKNGVLLAQLRTLGVQSDIRYDLRSKVQLQYSRFILPVYNVN